MASGNNITVKITFTSGLSLWEAIKLRIAGKAYIKVYQPIMDKIVNGLEQDKPDLRTFMDER
jgi:hypothetical protein